MEYKDTLILVYRLFDELVSKDSKNLALLDHAIYASTASARCGGVFIFSLAENIRAQEPIPEYE